MSNKYPTANITLSSIEDKGLTLKIKDSEGKSWTLWKNEYQTNQPSEAYEGLMNYKIGETFGVTYGEKQEEYQGKSYTKRTIYSILPPVSNPSPATSTNPLYSKSEPAKDDKFWEQQAYEKCLSLWAAAEIQSGNELTKLVDNKIFFQASWELFKAIKAEGKKQFFDFTPSRSETTERPDLPIIDSETPALSELGCVVCGMSGVVADDGHDCIPF